MIQKLLKEEVRTKLEFCSSHIVKYPDCNATQNLFGGKLLAWVDEKAAIFASKHMKEDLVVTAHFGGLDFAVPAELRKVVRIYAEVLHEGNTSLKVGVLVTKSSLSSVDEIIIARNEIIFVSVDKNGKPKQWL